MGNDRHELGHARTRSLGNLAWRNPIQSGDFVVLAIPRRPPAGRLALPVCVRCASACWFVSPGWRNVSRFLGGRTARRWRARRRLRKTARPARPGAWGRSCGPRCTRRSASAPSTRNGDVSPAPTLRRALRQPAAAAGGLPATRRPAGDPHDRGRRRRAQAAKILPEQGLHVG